MSITAPETVHDDPQDQEQPHAPSETLVGASVLGHLRQRKQEIERSETKFELLEIPAWDGALAIRFEYPDGGSDQIINAVVKAQETSKPGRVLEANLDVLVACCADVLGRQPGGEWERLDPADERPLRFTPRLASLLQIEMPEMKGNPAKWLCRNLFSPKAQLDERYEGDVQLMNVAGKVVLFLQTGKSSSDGTLAGE